MSACHMFSIGGSDRKEHHRYIAFEGVMASVVMRAGMAQVT
jgi:hypothetical protein